MRLERKNSNRIFILPISEKGALKMRKAYKKLTYADRQEIEQMSERGEKPKAIADATGVCFQTIYRELQRGKTKTVNIKRKLHSSHYLHRTGQAAYAPLI